VPLVEAWKLKCKRLPHHSEFVKNGGSLRTNETCARIAVDV